MTNDNTLIFGGNDLLDYLQINNFGGIWAPMVFRVTPDVVPRKRGATVAPGAVLDQYTFSIQCGIEKPTETLFNEAMLALGAVLRGANSDGLDTLDRHLAKSGGGHYTQTADGLFAGFANLRKETPTAAFFDLQFTNLDGAWKDSVSHEWVTP